MSMIWRPGYVTSFADPDVQAYLTAVEEADNASLEYPVAVLIDEFIRGCKFDGIWDAIKAACIMAGARTLAGALVPLKGPAPTNVGFVAGDYNRKTGLSGDGVSKYLNSNRNNNADPQNSKHLSCFLTKPQSSVGGIHMGTNTASTPGTCQIASDLSNNSTNLSVNNTSVALVPVVTPSVGFMGASRSSSSNFATRLNGVTGNAAFASNAPDNIPIYIFCRNGNAVFSNAGISFYSIGESLNLALLDARVTTLMQALSIAIP